MSDASLLLFIVTSVVIILTPGQDMVLLLSRSITLGPKAGAVTAAGVASGLLGHTLLVALGLGSLLQASEQAFTLMKYAGAAYLLYLGYKTFRTPAIDLTKPVQTGGNLRTFFLQGAFSNISNPKIAIFYFAYLPQFVSTNSTQPTQELLALGIIFAVLTFVLKLPIGYLAGRCSGWIKSRPALQNWLNRGSGTVLVGMGISLATESHSKG